MDRAHSISTAAAITDAKTISLYELAKRKVWNPSLDLSWPRKQQASEFPLRQSANPLCGYSEYEQSPRSKQLEAAWLLHGIELSEILFGEQTALMLAAQLVQHASSTESQLFLSSQVFDEARHVEFFMRYLSEHVGEIHPPSRTLKHIAQEALSSECAHRKYLICHALIESLALAKFQLLRAQATQTILTSAIDLIMKDEARHVAFGTDTLEREVAQMPSQLRSALAVELIDKTLALGQEVTATKIIARRFSWNEIALRQHIQRHTLDNAALGKLSFRYLTLTMRRIGLWCDQCQERLHSAQAKSL